MHQLLHIVWNPEIEAFSIFGITIRYYSILFVTGLILAYWVISKLYKDQKIPYEKFDSLFIYCLLGIVVGARLGHCLFYEPSYWLSHPLEMILPVKFTDGGIKWTGYQGLASHGGTIGLLLSLWFYARKMKLNYLSVLDNIAIATPIAACFIRLGNLMNGEIVGKLSNVPWASFSPAKEWNRAIRHNSMNHSLSHHLRHRTVFIQEIQNLPPSGVLFRLLPHHHLRFRFFVEFIKASQEAYEDSMMLNMGQWLSIPFILIGAHFMYHSFKPAKNK